MKRKWIVGLLGVVVLAAVRTEGRSTGAPTDACSTFTPNHGSNSAQTGDGGFKLYSDLIDNGGSYVSNQAYNSELEICMQCLLVRIQSAWLRRLFGTHGSCDIFPSSCVVTLRHEDSTTTFRGFLIGARSAASNLVRLGSFSTDASSQLLNCANFGTDTSTVIIFLAHISCHACG